MPRCLKAVADSVPTAPRCFCRFRSKSEQVVPGWFPTIDATQAKSVEVVLSSSRRVKKGPGRRPQSAKRQRSLKLLAQGWTPAAARRGEVGVSRATSHNWRGGHTVRLKDGTVRFVPPLDPLITKTISPRFLSEAERIEIADRHHAGESARAIADAISRAPSTVSRELRRNAARTADTNRLTLTELLR
jgi:Helix-turn-helix domain